MNLSLGIVGLPNVGKSTLFSTITKKQISQENYPFCTIDPNVGIVSVPDKRVDFLAELFNSKKKVYTTVEFVDIAGLIKGAAQGEGLGNKFLANIREVNAIVYVLRCFKKNKIINTLERIDPLLEKETLETELILKDLETVNKRIPTLNKEAKAGQKQAIAELNVLLKAQEFLQKGSSLIECNWQEQEKTILWQYQLLSLKPRLYLLNGDKKEVDEQILEVFKKNNWSYLIIDLAAEAEAINFTEKERQELGLDKETELNVLIRASYELLGLITFLTTGEDETRAWALKKGLKAPQAGGIIHTDFEKSFVKAEVINWQKLFQTGSWLKAKEKGLVKLEGKDYEIKDGDVIEIKHG